MMKAPRSISAFEAFMKSAMAVRPVHVVYTNASGWNIDSKFSHSQWSLQSQFLEREGGTDNRASLRRVREFCSALGRGCRGHCCELRFLARFLGGGSGGQAWLSWKFG